MAVTLTGTNFVVGATTVTVSRWRRDGQQRRRGQQDVADRQLRARSGRSEGPRTVTVTTAAGTSGAQTFTVTVPLPPGTPTLTSVSPNQGVRGTTVAVTLTGTNFVAGATTVTVGGGGVTVTNVAVSSGTSLTANFVLDPAAADGPRTVTVTTAIGTSGPRIFTISLPPPGAPTLTSVTPNQGIQGTTVAVTLTGTNFVVGATTVAVSGGGVTVTTVVVGSSDVADRQLRARSGRGCWCPLGDGHDGRRDQRRANLHDQSAAGPGTPTLTSVSPNQGLRGTTVAVTLTGTNFVVGATTVTVSGGGVTVTTVVVGSSTSLTANFVLDPAAAAGPRIVTVTTAGGTSAPQGFTISLPPPTLTSVSPNQGSGATTVAVTLTGTNFVAGATTVAVSRWRRDGHQRRRGQQHVADRQLRARSGRSGWSPHGDGHDRRRNQRSANLHDQSAAARFRDVHLYGRSADLYCARRRRQRSRLTATGAAGGKGNGAALGPRWHGRSDDGDRVRRAWRVAHGACRWQRSRWPSALSTAGGFNGGGAKHRRRRRRRGCLERA